MSRYKRKRPRSLKELRKNNYWMPDRDPYLFSGFQQAVYDEPRGGQKASYAELFQPPPVIPFGTPTFTLQDSLPYFPTRQQEKPKLPEGTGPIRHNKRPIIKEEIRKAMSEKPFFAETQLQEPFIPGKQSQLNIPPPIQLIPSLSKDFQQASDTLRKVITSTAKHVMGPPAPVKLKETHGLPLSLIPTMPVSSMPIRSIPEITEVPITPIAPLQASIEYHPIPEIEYPTRPWKESATLSLSEFPKTPQEQQALYFKEMEENVKRKESQKQVKELTPGGLHTAPGTPVSSIVRPAKTFVHYTMNAPTTYPQFAPGTSERNIFFKSIPHYTTEYMSRLYKKLPENYRIGQSKAWIESQVPDKIMQKAPRGLDVTQKNRAINEIMYHINANWAKYPPKPFYRYG